MERCPFCGHQLITCDCLYKHFYPAFKVKKWDYKRQDWTKDSHPTGNLPENVYKHGPPEYIANEWERRLEEKGRIPFVQFPNMCALCGKLWPDMFRVEDWEQVVPLELRTKMLCYPCYQTVKKSPDITKPQRCIKCGTLAEHKERDKDFVNRFFPPLIRKEIVCEKCFEMIHNWIIKGPPIRS